ncbi:hypothetical protein K7X08_003174 [Anisodus acutangulus]|uniref:AMP-dependent synthetase/ligase domain-containing protein n=1 Tax=Anisodus acutangulus TaxID=402998 RepID=A0A9Q1RI07_9SOLA|nr:hypothetical protein K7X08_003174 [Anisodus acutangulus]
MSGVERWIISTGEDEQFTNHRPSFDRKSGYDPVTGIYHSVLQLSEKHKMTSGNFELDTAKFVLSQFQCPAQAESQIALIDSATNQNITYAKLHRSIFSLATGLYHALAVLSIGAILSPANHSNTELEIGKQVRLSGATLAIATPEEAHKLVPTDPAILYSSGTTGVSKVVVLTHANFVVIMKLLKYYVDAASLGLFCSGDTTVLMQKFDFQAMLEAVQTHKISHIPAVPPVILGLVKHNKGGYDLSSFENTDFCHWSQQVADAFREKFPWVELKQGYGLTETTGAATFFVTNEEVKARPSSVGMLFPGFSAELVNHEKEETLPPFKEGELWVKVPGVYFGNEEATAATITKDGWLRTGDLCWRGVAPAEHEAILLSHHQILDAAVVP